MDIRQWHRQTVPAPLRASSMDVGLGALAPGINYVMRMRGTSVVGPGPLSDVQTFRTKPHFMITPAGEEVSQGTPVCFEVCRADAQIGLLHQGARSKSRPAFTGRGRSLWLCVCAFV